MVRLFSLTLLLLALQGISSMGALLKNRTVSSSGAFVVYAEDAGWRGRISRDAERALDVWNKRIGAPVAASSPIIIQDLSGDIRPKGIPATQLMVFSVEGGGTKVQLDLWDKSVVDGDMLWVELFRALVLHGMHRNKPPKPGSALESPPEWLVEGLAESMREREGEVPSGVHVALLRSDRPPSLGRFLKERPGIMDSHSLVLYRAQAYALLEVLQASPDSKRRLTEFLEKIPSLAGIDGLLGAFPEIGKNETELTKRWTLSIAKTSMPQQHSSLGVNASNDALNGLLDISAPADPKDPDTEQAHGAVALPVIAKTKEGARLLRDRSLECIALEFRAHPMMKPIIAEYRRIFMTLERKPKAKVSEEIEKLEALRALLIERHGEMLNYLNWYEAPRLDGPGRFLLDRIPELPPIPPRTDPVTRALAGVEALAW